MDILRNQLKNKVIYNIKDFNHQILSEPEPEGLKL